MEDNFEKALKVVLHHEGGWSDHKDDLGGATMKGVTLKTYSDWLKRPATKDELRNISDEDLQEIYRRLYWDRVAGDRLPFGVDLCVFDMAVNAGPGRAIKILQAIVGSTPDGGIGPQTLAAVAKQNPLSLIKQYSEARRVFYKSLGAYITFGKGWLRRVDEVESEAYKLIGV